MGAIRIRHKGRAITTTECIQVLQGGEWRCRQHFAEAIGMEGADPVILPVVGSLLKQGRVKRKKMNHPSKPGFKVWYYKLV
jgi:hypothetical protein